MRDLNTNSGQVATCARLVYHGAMSALDSLIENLPSRRSIVDAHKQSGGHVAAIYPIHHPRALWRAHGFLPVEVWGPPGRSPTAADAHIQPYVCSVVRCGLSFLLEDGLDSCDLLVVPHTCDSLQGLGSLLLDLQPPRQPVLTFYLPRGEGGNEIAYLHAELKRLNGELAEISGLSPDHDTLMAAVKREEEADLLLGQLLASRPRIALQDRNLYRLLRSREYLPAERFIALATEILSHLCDPPRSESARIPLLLSGIAPEPMELLDAITEVGGIVVGDDLAAVGRRCYLKGDEPDPLLRLATSLLSAAPCTTRGASLAARTTHLLELARHTGAKGVVFLEIKFCEPELFYLPRQRQALEEAGLPSVVIEIDLSEGLTHQALTRVEALLETLR